MARCPESRSPTSSWQRSWSDAAAPWRHWRIALTCAGWLIACNFAVAQVDGRSTTTHRAAASEEGIRWAKLKPAQREALKPLQQDWATIDAPRKQKWVELADRMPAMPAEERARVQGRMAEWAKLSPLERGQTRAQFQEAKQLPDRRSRWEQYQALSPEEKSQLAARSRAADGAGRRSTGVRADGSERLATDGAQPKSNLVPNPSYSAPPRPVAPTIVQAAPGATTTLVTRRPAPPPHQHTGLPKIAATPEFVNGSTLLPKRGAQGAAVRPVPPGEAASAGRR